jgi:hypothetical protein
MLKSTRCRKTRKATIDKPKDQIPRFRPGIKSKPFNEELGLTKLIEYKSFKEVSEKIQA